MALKQIRAQSPLEIILSTEDKFIYFALHYVSLYCQPYIIKGKLDRNGTTLKLNQEVIEVKCFVTKMGILMSLASTPVLDILMIDEVSPNIQFLLFSAYHEWRAKYDAVLTDQEFWACRLCTMLNEKSTRTVYTDVGRVWSKEVCTFPQYKGIT